MYHLENEVFWKDDFLQFQGKLSQKNAPSKGSGPSHVLGVGKSDFAL
jgi:hypothetical protein